MLFFFFYLIIGLIFAFICVGMARKRGRDAALWGVLGFFLGIIAVIILAVAGDAETISHPGTTSNSALDEIAKLKKLLDDGVLSEEEFQAQKQKLLE